MSMSMIETDPILQNASITDPACIEAGDACPAFEAAHTLSQKVISYNHQFEYGHYISWYLVAILGIFTICFGFQKWTERKLPGASAMRIAGSQVPGLQKVKAAVRYVSYRRISGTLSDRLGMPSAGMIILITLFTLYCLLLTFIARPYYRTHRGYGSPPLGVRTGLMAIALTPWIIALSGKANLITMLTGIGHEKLNIIHRWISRICFGLSVIHTVPFIVAPLRDGGYAALSRAFHETGSFEYTGVPPLAILFGIVVLSLRWIRHKFYESFYLLHVLLGISYLGLMYWHAGNLGDSWIYLWMTVAVWLFSIVIRAFWYNRALNIQQSNWCQGFETDVTLLAGEVTRVVVRLPETIPVRPGQHCFIRFPAISVFDNHPFTVAWTDSSEIADEKQTLTPSLTFLVRSRKGFTAKLAESVEKIGQEATNVWLDGPYGGIQAGLEARYDQVILIAGGIGITGCLPWLQCLLRRRSGEGSHTRLSSVKMVWVVHEAAHLAWAEAWLLPLLQSSEGSLEISVHCTTLSEHSSNSNVTNAEMTDIEKAANASEQPAGTADAAPLDLLPGRPNLDTIISDARPGRVAVIGCGPNSLKVDLSNACAKAQSRVLKGELEELSLHTETFGW